MSAPNPAPVTTAQEKLLERIAKALESINFAISSVAYMYFAFKVMEMFTK